MAGKSWAKVTWTSELEIFHSDPSRSVRQFRAFSDFIPAANFRFSSFFHHVRLIYNFISSHLTIFFSFSVFFFFFELLRRSDPESYFKTIITSKNSISISQSYFSNDLRNGTHFNREEEINDSDARKIIFFGVLLPEKRFIFFFFEIQWPSFITAKLVFSWRSKRSS